MQRAALLSAAGVVGVAGLAVALWTQPDDIRSEPAESYGVQALGVQSSRPAVAAENPYVDSKEQAEKIDVDELVSEAQRLQTLARYPQWSQPLRLVGDPFADGKDDKLSAASAGETSMLNVYSEHASFDAPEPIVIHADATDSAELTGTVYDVGANATQAVRFVREMRRDAADSGLAHYRATFTPAATDRPNGGYVIQVSAVDREGRSHEARLELMYNRPYALLTGRFRDRFDNGNLVIEAQLEVRLTATFRLQASLYGQQQQPLALASVARSLEPGTHWVPLAFHGLILREQRIDGPYLLRFIALTTATRDAEAVSRPLEQAYVTQSYDSQAFVGEAAENPELLAEAAELRERTARLQAH